MSTDLMWAGHKSQLNRHLAPTWVFFNKESLMMLQTPSYHYQLGIRISPKNCSFPFTKYIVIWISNYYVYFNCIWGFFRCFHAWKLFYIQNLNRELWSFSFPFFFFNIHTQGFAKVTQVLYTLILVFSIVTSYLGWWSRSVVPDSLQPHGL